MPSPSEWVHSVAAIIERFTPRWAIAGALAAGEYRLAQRLTSDADIYVEWRPELIPALEDAGYNVRSMTDPDVGHPHLLICSRGDERIDLMVPTVPYQELALDRATDHRLTVEDVIIHKLIAWRPRDLDDIGSILLAGHHLDEAYIDHWAAEWDVSERWAQIRGI